MAIFGLISGLAKSAGQYGEGVRQRTEGEGSYDPFTGKFYDKGKVERMSVIGSIANPAGVLRDPYLKPHEKLLAASGLGGLVMGKRADRIEAENVAMAEKYGELKGKVEDLPTYQVSSEAEENLQRMQETSGELSDIGQEISDIATKKTSQAEMEEAQIQRENIKQASAGRLQAIQESGSEQSLDAIAKSGSIGQQQLRDLNKKQTAYRFQAENDLMNAKINQASLEAAGGQLEAGALSGIVSEKGKVYQSELNKQLTGINMDIARYSQGQMGQIQAQQNATQNNTAFASNVANLAMSYIQNRSMNQNKTE